MDETETAATGGPPPGDTGVDVGETGGTGSNGMTGTESAASVAPVGGLGAEGDNTEEATDIANAHRGNEAPSG